MINCLKRKIKNFINKMTLVLEKKGYETYLDFKQGQVHLKKSLRKT